MNPCTSLSLSRLTARLLAGTFVVMMALNPTTVRAQSGSAEIRVTSLNSVWSYTSAGWYRGTDGSLNEYFNYDWGTEVWTRAGATNQWLWEATSNGPNFGNGNEANSTNYQYLVDWWPDFTQSGTRWWTNASVIWEFGQQVLDDHTTGTQPDQPVPVEPAPWLYIRHAFTNIWSNLDPGNENEGWSIDRLDKTTQIEILTGGEPGLTNEVPIQLRVEAWDAAGVAIDPCLTTVLGQTPGSNGILLITTNEHLVLDCTPSLPTNYTDYRFAVSIVPQGGGGGGAAPPEPEIDIWFDFGLDSIVTGKTTTVLIGQRVRLRAALKPGGPPGWGIQSVGWASSYLNDSRVVAGYSATATNGGPLFFLQSSTNNNPLTFYFWQPSGTQPWQVGVNVTITNATTNAKRFRATYFKVNGRPGTLTATRKSGIVVQQNPGDPLNGFLRFGNPAGPPGYELNYTFARGAGEPVVTDRFMLLTTMDYDRKWEKTDGTWEQSTMWAVLLGTYPRDQIVHALPAPLYSGTMVFRWEWFVGNEWRAAQTKHLNQRATLYYFPQFPNGDATFSIPVPWRDIAMPQSALATNAPGWSLVTTSAVPATIGSTPPVNYQMWFENESRWFERKTNAPPGFTP